MTILGKHALIRRMVDNVGSEECFEDSFRLLTDKQVFIAILWMAALAVLLT